MVIINHCFDFFTKPERLNILSWFRHYLEEHRDLEVYIPLHMKPASGLVGAPLGTLTHEEVVDIHANVHNSATGWVYDEPAFQKICDVTSATLKANDR